MIKRRALLLAAAVGLLVVCGAAAFGFGGGGQRRHEVAKAEEEEVDLYAVLGLDVDASDKDIKSAYRKLSMQYHPDRTGGDEAAADKFREVSRAYEVLSNEEKKFLYDSGGMALLKQAAEHEGRGDGGMGGFFGGFFGGGGMGGNKGQDYQLHLRVTLEELYGGAEKEARITRRVVCRGCDKPAKELSDKARARCGSCGRCPNEVRMVHRQMGGFIVQQQEEVPSKHKCKNEPKALSALVERGMQDGHQLRFKYASEQSPGGRIPGDVVLILQQQKHSRFERQGHDLRMTIRISLKEALTGFEKRFSHLDDHEVVVDRAGRVTRPMEQVRLEGEGMPHHDMPSQFGDLVLTFEVVFPPSLTEEQIKTINEILP